MVVKHVDLRFNNVNYKQSDGLVNGSPPVLNHIFVGYYVVARLLKIEKYLLYWIFVALAHQEKRWHRGVFENNIVSEIYDLS